MIRAGRFPDMLASHRAGSGVMIGVAMDLSR
jgi:hypothetical protein